MPSLGSRMGVQHGYVPPPQLSTLQAEKRALSSPQSPHRPTHANFGQRSKNRGLLSIRAPALTSRDDWGKIPEEAKVDADRRTGTLSIDGEGNPRPMVQPFKRFWRSYNRLLDSRPILTKSLTSLFGFMIGDILAQVLTGQPYNPLRTARLTLFGIVMDGPVGHWWYTTLDRLVYPDAPKSNKAIVTKTAFDQLLWAPAFTCVFFTFMCCLEGRPHMILASIQQKLLKVMITNYAVWPLAHLINFKFVPSSQRILYINGCQILWSSYLSMCQANA